MNLIAYGNQNIILNGRPTKTFFKSTYMKYTNFGLQKFRIEHEGLRQLDLTKETHYTFKMPRYGDLLMDTYLAIKLPHIWSPLYKKTVTIADNGGDVEKFTYIPYEFKWIEELGTQIIKEIRIRCGNTTLQQYSGEYISVCAKRDYSGQKLNVFNTMIGNTPPLTNPAFPFDNFSSITIDNNVGYPTAFFDKTSLRGGGPEPSIRGRMLYVPLNAWFCNNSKQPFPMVAAQYSELFIDITLRPLKELFVIRDVSNHFNGTQDRLSYTIYNNVFNDETKEFVINTFASGGNNETVIVSDTTLNGISNREVINYNIHSFKVNYKILVKYTNSVSNEQLETILNKLLTVSKFADTNMLATEIEQVFITFFGNLNNGFLNIPYVQIIKYAYDGTKLITLLDNNYEITETTKTTGVFSTKKNVYTYIDNNNITSIEVKQDITNATIQLNNIVIISQTSTNDTITYDPPVPNDDVEIYTANGNTDEDINPFFIADHPYIAPNFNLPEHAMFRFLHPPPNPLFDYSNTDTRVQFNTDIHLISTYGFLSEEENRELSQKEQTYLIKDVREYTIRDLVGTQKVELESTGLISNWTFFMRRSDADIRNEWNNYTNWSYKYSKPQLTLNRETIRNLYIQPGQLYDPDIIGENVFTLNDASFVTGPLDYNASGPFNIQNDKGILKKIEILLDGKIRESKFDRGIFEYIEPFMRTSGGYEEGLNVYNFGLKTDPYSIQPNGAINLSKFSKIELEIDTEAPPLDPDAEFNVVCANVDNTAGNDVENTNNGNQIIGVNKESFRLYKYTYDLRLFEEKYNVVTFVAGNCGLMFSR